MPTAPDTQVKTPPNSWPIDQWQYLYGKPQINAKIRVTPADFLVDEVLGFVPEEAGTHLWVNITKQLLNTTDVAKMLANGCAIALKDVGYSGLKDHNAITSQWFSVPLENNLEDMTLAVQVLCAEQDLLVLNHISTHPKKLKRGVHRKNQFSITLRDLSAVAESLEPCLETIREHGVPNYFGNQRFGRNGKNLQTAAKLFTHKRLKMDRIARSMALSSARSWIFNEALSTRLADGRWNQVEIGDMLQLNGSNAVFLHDGSDPSIVDRIAAHNVHITGPLWGEGELQTQDNIRVFETALVEQFALFSHGLSEVGLKQQRRSLRLVPEEFKWEFLADNALRLHFKLPRGCFATAVLRELVSTD